MKDVKDWTGNYHSIYTTLGASKHELGERAKYDYYATEPRAVELLLEQEKFAPVIWECACCEGHVSKVLEQAGYKVISTDLIYRGFGQNESLDFLSEMANESFDGDIITNLPYKYALEFLEQAIKVIKPQAKVAIILKLTFLEGKKRRKFFEKNPPKFVYVSSARLFCAMCCPQTL